MATLNELLRQKAEIEKAIEQATTQHKAESIEKVKALMADLGVTVADLGGKASKGKALKSEGGRSKVAPKYQNSATGDSWSGRGLQPKWLKTALASGRKIEEFAV